MVTAFTWVALILSSVSVVTAGYAVKAGLPATKVLAAMTGVLSVIYAVAYGWLLLSDMDEAGRVRWSDAMRGVSMVTWACVWIGWPMASVRLYRRAHRRLAELAGDGDGSG